MDSSAEMLDDLGDIEFELGWADSALVHYRASEEADTTEIHRAWVYWESGERELAERHLRALTALAREELEEGSQSSFPYIVLMTVHAIRGAEEEAVDALASAVDRGWRVYRWFDDIAVLRKTRERLRDNERFQRILRELGARGDSMRAEAERRGCVR